MMFGLLYKDLLISKKELMMIIGVFAVFTAFMFMPLAEPEYRQSICVVFYIVIDVITSIIGLSVFVYDERKKWASFIVSTPEIHHGQVLSKYLYYLFVQFSVLVMNILSGVITSAVYKFSFSFFIPVFALIFSLTTALAAVEIPFVVRFTTKYGKVYKIVIMWIIVVFILIYFLFGDLSSLKNGEVILNLLITQMKSSGGTPAALIIAVYPVLSLILYFISYLISCCLYKRGIEMYEK